jgi:DNA-binding NarL/FixJ family response regulator
MKHLVLPLKISDMSGRNPEEIKITLFTDQENTSETISIILDSVADYSLTGSITSSTALCDHVETHRPDVVILSVDAPPGIGMQALMDIKGLKRKAKVLMYTSSAESSHVFDALRAGADGYILRPAAPVKIIEYIRELHDGGAPLTPKIARLILNTFATKPYELPKYKPFTGRETDVLKLLVQGMSYKMISDALFISIDTVRSHIRSIYDKLQVTSKSQAVAKAILQKLV